jgi:hypothetical protein
MIGEVRNKYGFLVGKHVGKIVTSKTEKEMRG